MKHHTVKTYGGMDAQLHAYLNSAADGGEWSAPCPGSFTWVGPNAGLNAVTRRKKKSLPQPGIEPRSSSPSSISAPTELKNEGNILTIESVT
jgi:hypothetical protein